MKKRSQLASKENGFWQSSCQNFFVAFAFCFAFLVPYSMAASASDDAHELMEACMLSDRLLKDYALIGMGVTYHDPSADITRARARIGTILEHMSDGHMQETFVARIKQLAGDWKMLEPMLSKTPNLQDVQQLKNLVNSFSDQCESLAEEVALDTKVVSNKDVVRIASLGIQVQKLASLYMVRSWGSDDPAYFEQVAILSDEFKNILGELQNEKDEVLPLELKEKLVEVSKRFFVFEFIVNSKSKNVMVSRAEKLSTEVYEEILEIMKTEEGLVE